jgi:thiamine-phosphate pyrophosphorylase
MKLIVITSDCIVENEAAIWNTLFERGMATLHLRKPSASENDIRNLLLQTKPGFLDRIVLHDRFALINSFSLKGIHLNRRNPIRPQKIRSSVSRSCHAVEELEAIGDFDYVFLSPIFDSISKSDYAQAFTAEELLSAQSHGLINEKVVALGGIDTTTIPLAARYGFGGVAVLGALWGNYRQDKDQKTLIKRFDELLATANKQGK